VGSLLELSLRWEISALSEEQSRSGKEVSPKQELTEPPSASCWSSPLSESLKLERKASFA